MSYGSLRGISSASPPPAVVRQVSFTHTHSLLLCVIWWDYVKAVSEGSVHPSASTGKYPRTQHAGGSVPLAGTLAAVVLTPVCHVSVRDGTLSPYPDYGG